MRHPSSSISEDLLMKIRQYAADAELLGELHPAQLEIIYEQQWFNMYVPKAYGGLALSLPEIVRKEEAIAWADGSAAWVVTLCSGAAWFVGFLNSELAGELFPNREICFAGSGAPDGVATIHESGFEITGSWPYASGASHATLFTANCILKKDGVILRHHDGSAIVRSFLFKKEEVRQHATWKSIGMVATGSHSFEVKSLLVPLNRHFIIEPIHAVLKGPLYQYPFLSLAEVTLAANYSGMAIRFLELAEEIVISKPSYSKHDFSSQVKRIEQWKQKLDAGRSYFYQALEASWSLCEGGGVIPPEVLQRVGESSFSLYQISLQLVDELYPICGLAAADPRTEINRVWRNIHTASQHAMFASRL